MTPKQRRRLIRMVNDHITMAGDDEERSELEQLVVALENVIVTPDPVTLDENIGSCEPGDFSGPLIRWDKTGSVWHTDVDKVGRYSLQRINRQWVAFLNNKPIEAISPGELDAMKRNVERRIDTARRINAMPFQSPLGARHE